MNDFFVKISGFFDFHIPHFSDSFDSRLQADRTGHGLNATPLGQLRAWNFKFALIKLTVRNNNSDLWFNSISIFHITGFSAGILLSSEHFIFFWNISWFVSVCRLRLTLLKSTDTVICFDFLISSGRARATHTHYALRRVIVSCFLIQLISRSAKRRISEIRKIENNLGNFKS